MPRLTTEEYEEILDKMGMHNAGTSSVITTSGNLAKAKGRILKPKMTDVEAEYASKLAERTRAGEVLWWMFEAMTLVLKYYDLEEEKEVRFTPDFDVMLANNELEFVETKGPYRYEDSWIKLKIAASIYPFRFRFAQRDKDKNWSDKAL